MAGLAADVSLLALAIVNNVGHVHEQSFESEQANGCLQQLHCLLPFAAVSDDYVHFRETPALSFRGATTCAFMLLWHSHNTLGGCTFLSRLTNE